MQPSLYRKDVVSVLQRQEFLDSDKDVSVTPKVLWAGILHHLSSYLVDSVFFLVVQKYVTLSAVASRTADVFRKDNEWNGPKMAVELDQIHTDKHATAVSQGVFVMYPVHVGV